MMTMLKKLISTTLTASATLVVLLGSSNALAAPVCTLDVGVSEAMAFSTKNIDVPKACKEFTINLKVAGTMPKAVMGHNLVISKTADLQPVVDDGNKAGLAGNYVKAKDARVVVATKVIGGGEKTTSKFKVSKLNAKDSYMFYCSFPGHSGMMKGTVKLV